MTKLKRVMGTHKGGTNNRVGKTIGYLLGFFVFTTVLYFVLVYLGKLPVSWGYHHVTGITFGITFLGALIRGYLK